ncbi:hypothetical protein D3C77_290610 [compost metagenome]
MYCISIMRFNHAFHAVSSSVFVKSATTNDKTYIYFGAILTIPPNPGKLNARSTFSKTTFY